MMLGDVTTQTARKPHRCHWCGEEIEVGANYQRWLWKDGRNVLPTKAHHECAAAWSTLDPNESEVMCGEFCRGCTCQRGYCKCSPVQIS